MTARAGRLIAVDGINGTAVLAAAKEALAESDRTRRGGISRWDASGVFEELTVADANAGAPSARTLLLLYAADLAFRLRWEVRPALAEGRAIVAAPYVDTAVAFGRAAGIPGPWLTNLFQFAPRPNEKRVVTGHGARAVSDREGFVEFGWAHWSEPVDLKRRLILDRAAAHLHAVARRRPGR